jgi:hypothetical protein
MRNIGRCAAGPYAVKLFATLQASTTLMHWQQARQSAWQGLHAQIKVVFCGRKQACIGMFCINPESACTVSTSIITGMRIVYFVATTPECRPPCAQYFTTAPCIPFSEAQYFTAAPCIPFSEAQYFTAAPCFPFSEAQYFTAAPCIPPSSKYWKLHSSRRPRTMQWQLLLLLQRPPLSLPHRPHRHAHTAILPHCCNARG